uniref:Uncharacterized protein n=1 Tax=Rhizophora mucronata TaxID=61149 RepID=A0A2P2IT99_RHIMU
MGIYSPKDVTRSHLSNTYSKNCPCIRCKAGVKSQSNGHGIVATKTRTVW